MADAALHLLLAWNSPAYPIGGFSYSHGLETAVETGAVAQEADARAYIAGVLEHGGGWVDAVLFAHAYRAAADAARLDEIAELGAAFRASRETAIESRQQGQAFLDVTRKVWPHAGLENFARRHAGRPVAHAVVGGLAAALHGVALRSALVAYLHGVAANLVSAAVRLVPLGQTDGQLATARLAGVIDAVASRALACPLEDLGTSAPMLELASLHHETLYTRLFRS